jgi:hypothetical protein
MLEKDMEDLIADYPDDFFPDRGFELRGRQESFAGVGRFDLLFEDRFKTKILMELKAVPAKYEVATQLAKYRDELHHRGENHILMWLVAPQVSHSVREFLDRIGIEYSEIHLVEFRRVAERHGVLIRSEAPQPVQRENPQERVVRQKIRNPSEETVLSNDRSREYIKPTITELWDKQQRWVTRDQLAEKLGEQSWVIEALDAAGIVDAGERRHRVGNQIDWFSADYKKGKYGLADEFERDRVDRKWAYRPKH